MSVESNPWNQVHRAFADMHAEAKALYDAHMTAGKLDDIHALIELQRRVRQLGWILQQVESLEDEAVAAGMQDAMLGLAKLPGAEEASDRAELATIAVEAQCDAFYAIAFRIIDLTRKRPNLKVDPKGVNRVRNLFIIHPEHNGGVKEFSFGLGGGQTGPVYKPAQSPGQAGYFQDPGIIANALEFAAALSKRLREHPHP